MGHGDSSTQSDDQMPVAGEAILDIERARDEAEEIRLAAARSIELADSKVTRLAIAARTNGASMETLASAAGVPLEYACKNFATDEERIRNDKRRQELLDHFPSLHQNSKELDSLVFRRV